MAVREFHDATGSRWRVWSVTPEAIHPVTRAEDYLADCYQLGWLVFESTTGDKKRRLCPFPQNWERRDELGLQQLLMKADVVPTVVVPEGRPDLTDLEVVRTFRYPGGSVWTVRLTSPPERGNGAVLRFTAGARSLDLVQWPPNWPDLPDDGLIALLRRAGRRAWMLSTPETPRRRYDDPLA